MIFDLRVFQVDICASCDENYYLESINKQTNKNSRRIVNKVCRVAGRDWLATKMNPRVCQIVG